MLGMEIKLNKKRIENKEDFSYEDFIYTLDKYFKEYGFEIIQVDEARRYLGHNHPDDLSNLGIIRSHLIKAKWFMQNLNYWYLLDSDNNEDPNNFIYEDILSTLERRNKLLWLDKNNIEVKKGVNIF